MGNFFTDKKNRLLPGIYPDGKRHKAEIIGAYLQANYPANRLALASISARAAAASSQPCTLTHLPGSRSL